MMRTKHLLVGPGIALAFMLICLLTLRLFAIQTYAQTGPCSSKACLATEKFKTDRDYPPIQTHIIEAASVFNGNFENGPDGTWTEYSAWGLPVILTSTVLPVTPHSGNWAVWLGGVNDEVSIISQTVAITSGESTLSYWQWIASLETECNYDFGKILINGIEVYSIGLCDDTNTYGWVKRIVNLSAYIGQDIDLQFRVETDSSLNSNLFIDDVSLGQGHYVYLPCIAKNDCGFHFFDDFSNPNSGWNVGGDGNYLLRYLSGEYQILLNYPESWAFGGIPSLDLPANYRLDVDTRQTSYYESAQGMLFAIGWNAQGNFEAYQFLVNPTTQEYLLDKRSMNGSWNALIPWTDASIINSGTATNHLRVEREGSAIRLYINGYWVDTVYDSSFTSPGRDVALYVDSFNQAPVDVRFDNFRADCVP